MVQVTKHVARVGGEQVFTGLFTLTNHLAQIRLCNFVATRSHSQYESALILMQKSLELYGHQQPCVVYTDNMADKHFLENAFPSLREDVVPVEKYANLKPLDLDEFGFKILPKDSTQSINDAIATILDDVPLDDGFIAVGFDSEWNVELSPQGFVVHSGRTAVIQIAHKRQVYVLQVGIHFFFSRVPFYLHMSFNNRSAT